MFMAEKHTRWRSHFPWFKKEHCYIEIKVDDPPLHAGKGENSWDMDDDGIFSMGVDGTTLEHGIAGYQKAVYRDRQKYGLPNGIHVALTKVRRDQIRNMVRYVFRGDDR
jgi:hypothetical protein